MAPRGYRRASSPGSGRCRALCVGGCGSSAIPTVVANPLPTAPPVATPGSSASPTIIAIESPSAAAVDTPTAAAGQHWTGTISSTSNRLFTAGAANYTCSDAWTGTLSFTVDAQDMVAGSGALNLNGEVSCTNPRVKPGTRGLPPPTQMFSFSVAGVQTTGGFTLQFSDTGPSPPGPGSIDVAGMTTLLLGTACPATPGPKLSIVFDRPNHATGSAALSTKLALNCYPAGTHGSENDIFSSTSTIVLNSP